MTKTNPTIKHATVTEGDEYLLTLDGRTLYQGIAESDEEATDRLDRYMLLIGATNNSTKFLKFRIINLSN